MIFYYKNALDITYYRNALDMILLKKSIGKWLLLKEYIWYDEAKKKKKELVFKVCFFGLYFVRQVLLFIYFFAYCLFLLSIEKFIMTFWLCAWQILYVVWIFSSDNRLSLMLTEIQIQM